MASSDDDGNSSSDDDLLLASPVFNKSKRRVAAPVDRGAARVEKNKLDFLQSCLQGSDARTDVQRRLNEIDEEFGLRDTAAVAGNKEEEKKDEEADDNNGGEGVSMNVNNGKLTPKCTNDSSTTSNSKESIAESSQHPSSSHNELATKKKQEEEAYWAKINSFVETNASSASTSKRTHSARRKLNDAISGLTGYASSDDEGGGNGHNENDDITDDEGGRWRDGYCGMTRERLRSEAEAKSRGSSSHIGLRKMFTYPTPLLTNSPRDVLSSTATTTTTTGKMDNFQTRQEAYYEIKSIIVTLHNSHCTPQTPSDKVLRKLFIDPFVQIMKQRNDDTKWDNIHNFLLNNPILLGRYGIVLPKVFCLWLWKMAISSYTVGRHLSTTCYNMIRKFLSQQMDELEEKALVNDTITTIPLSSLSFRVDMTFLHNYYMNDLISCLVNDYGLWLDDGPMPPTIHDTKEELTNNDNTTTSNNEKKNNNDRFSRVDVGTLKNIVILWSVLLDRNLIRIQDTNDDDEDKNNESLLFGKDASRLLVAFARVSLDPSFNDADMKYDTCGEPLIAVIHKLMSSLIMTATRQIMKRYAKNDGCKHVEQWMNYTSDLLVTACSNLEAGDDGTADCDDERGDLVLAMSVVRMCSYNTVDIGFSIDIAAMKMKFAEKALYKCLRDMVDCEEKVTARNNPFVDVNLHRAIHALLTAEIAFEYIHEESESMMQSHPHFLASVLIAGECAMIGASVYWRFWNDSQSEDELGMQQLTDESDTVYEILSNIEDLCDELKKECRAVIAYPHLRRTKEYLTRLAKEFGALKGMSSKDKGKKRRGQGSLDDYFSSQQAMSQSDPFVESQDS